jgi:hypothetical protein
MFRGHGGQDGMVIRFTSTYAIGAYHHWCCEFKSRSGRDAQHCDKVCQRLATGQWLSQGTPISSNYKTDRYDITEIWLKVALNTIKPNQSTVLQYNRWQDISLICLRGYGVKRHFQQYFSYILAVSFIGGWNPSTRKKTIDLSQVTDELYHLICLKIHLYMNNMFIHNSRDIVHVDEFLPLSFCI